MNSISKEYEDKSIRQDVKVVAYTGLKYQFNIDGHEIEVIDMRNASVDVPGILETILGENDYPKRVKIG